MYLHGQPEKRVGITLYFFSSMTDIKNLSSVIAGCGGDEVRGNGATLKVIAIIAP